MRDLDDQEMSTEAFSWFRNDRADIDRHRDGLTLFAAKILPAQSREDGDAFWVTATRDTQTATARAYGVIRVRGIGDTQARIGGGRLLQHAHLAATVARFELHPMNQVTECIARDAALGAPDRFSRRWAEAAGVPVGQGLLAFRIGYPERTPNPSRRRAVAEVVR